MNARMLKLIAIITMTVDHIGLYLIEDPSLANDILRSIGRIAFPLFAYFIAVGFYKTSNIKRYFFRLLAYAVIVELCIVGYFLATGVNFIFEANVFWVLVIGLLSLILLSTGKWYYTILVVAMMFGSELLKMPYGAYGIGLIIVFGFYRNFYVQVLYFLGLNLIFTDYPFMWAIGAIEFAKYPWFQWFSMLAMIPIYFYNGQRGRGSKWFFYLFYPVHLGAILLVSELIH